MYKLKVENFSLNEPLAMHSRTIPSQLAHHVDPNVVDVEELSEAADEAGLTTEITDESPNSGTTARTGHYHIYLNSAEGTDAHTTAWTEQGNYQIPETLPAGMHSLRFELRDNMHVQVQAETILFFEVVN